MQRIRSALAALFLIALLGGAQACAENPTAPADDVAEEGATCWWIDGMLHCRE